MSRQAVQAYFFVLVVVEHKGRYLLVREQKHGQRWYLPAGGLEPCETLVQAAVRETLEEAGVKIRPLGLLQIDHAWAGKGRDACTRWRYALLAEPLGSVEPKQVPDEHSLEARWVTIPELKQYELRGKEVGELFALAARRGPLLPVERYVVLPT